MLFVYKIWPGNIYVNNSLSLSLSNRYDQIFQILSEKETLSQSNYKFKLIVKSITVLTYFTTYQTSLLKCENIKKHNLKDGENNSYKVYKNRWIDDYGCSVCIMYKCECVCECVMCICMSEYACVDASVYVNCRNLLIFLPKVCVLWWGVLSFA